jgi:hypothetical protein
MEWAQFMPGDDTRVFGVHGSDGYHNIVNMFNVTEWYSEVLAMVRVWWCCNPSTWKAEEGGC